MHLRLTTQDPDFERRFADLLAMKREVSEEVNEVVRAIGVDVAARGDAAVIDYTARFDRLQLTPATLRVPRGEIEAALGARQCTDVLHIPTVFGGVAIAYNVSGVDGLVLDGETIAQIALGNITNLNDPAIAALNPGVSLPSQALTWVHRSDGSGTTSIFTKYLASVSQAWKDGPGSGSSVTWPAGIGADQNDGVAAAISQQPGGIGYVSYEFAAEIGLPVASVRNKDGNAIAPSSESVSIAAGTVTVPDDFRFDILGVGGQGYPIAGATWVLAYTCGMDAAKGDALRAFLTWALTDGTPSVTELNFAPLPDELRTRVLAAVDRINEEG